VPDHDPVTDSSVIPEAISTDWLDDLPVAVSPLDELIDYPPTTYSGEETMVVSTRIPISWASQFEEFRDKIGSRMPKRIWTKNSDLVRWCIGYGFKHLRTVQEQLDAGTIQPTPMLAAQHFLEQTGGQLAARAAVRADAREKGFKIGEALRDLMASQEYIEAADMLTAWFEGARALRDISPYWESTMLNALFRAPGIPRIIITLCRQGFITDDEILAQYDGLVEQDRRQTQDDLNTIPVSTQDDDDTDTDKNSPRRSG